MTGSGMPGVDGDKESGLWQKMDQLQAHLKRLYSRL